MIDTHAHLDDPLYSEHFNDFLREQKQAGVEAVIIPGVNPTSATSVIHTCKLASGFCFPALGLHPEEVKADWQEQLLPIVTALKTNKCIAVGEIGLDYHWEKTFVTEQKEALAEQLELALNLNLPVLLHNRDATEDMLRLLTPFCKRGLRGVMHCFTGSRETAERIINMGLYLGIGGVLTFKNSKLAETLTHVPLERIMLETDAPYLAPVPFRGKTNQPRYIRYVIERLAQVYCLSENEIETITSKNAHSLFKFNEINT